MAYISKSMASLSTLAFRISKSPKGNKILEALRPTFIKHSNLLGHIDLSYIAKLYLAHPLINHQILNAIILRTIRLKDKLEPFNYVNILPSLAKYNETTHLFDVLQSRILMLNFNAVELSIIILAYSKVRGDFKIFKEMENIIISRINEFSSSDLSMIIRAYTRIPMSKIFHELKHIIATTNFSSSNAFFMCYNYNMNGLLDKNLYR